MNAIQLPDPDSHLNDLLNNSFIVTYTLKRQEGKSSRLLLTANFAPNSGQGMQILQKIRTDMKLCFRG